MAIIPTPGDGFWPGIEMTGFSVTPVAAGPTGSAISTGIWSRDDGDTVTLDAGEGFVAGFYDDVPAGEAAAANWRIRIRGTGTIAVSDYFDSADANVWKTNPNSLTYTPVGTATTDSETWKTVAFTADTDAVTANYDTSTMVGRFEVTSGSVTLDWVCLRVQPTEGFYAKTGGGVWSSWYAGPDDKQVPSAKHYLLADGGPLTNYVKSTTVYGAKPSFAEAAAAAVALISQWESEQFAMARWPGLSGNDMRHDTGMTYYAGGFLGPENWYLSVKDRWSQGAKFVAPSPTANWAVVPDPGDWGIHWESTYDYAGETSLVRWDVEGWEWINDQYVDAPGIGLIVYSGGFITTDTGPVVVSVAVKPVNPTAAEYVDENITAPWVGATVAGSITVTPNPSESQRFNIPVTTLPAYDAFLVTPEATLGDYTMQANFVPVVSYPSWRYWRPEWDLAPAEDPPPYYPNFVMVTNDC